MTIIKANFKEKKIEPVNHEISEQVNDRIKRIKLTIEKINNVMSELKEMSKK